MNAIILLTATINPDGMAFTNLQDSSIRKQHYLSAINYYLSNTDLKIVLVENSNYDLSPYFIDEIKRRRIEILFFNGNTFDKSLGKGYGEMLILKYALFHSDFVKESNNILKITGRYKILNIDYFVKYINNIDKNNIGLYVHENFSYCHSTIFVANKDFLLNYLFRFGDLIDDTKNYFFEIALKNAFLSYLQNNHYYKPFAQVVRIKGVFGTYNVNYNDSYYNWLKTQIKYFFLRRISNKIKLI